MAIWQSISDTLIEEIESGVLEPGSRLPGDVELATRFGVNRHTVRRALSHLQTKGLVRSERGRGTFVIADAIAYRFGTRTRFEQNLLENMRIPSRQVLSTTIYAAAPSIAEPLRIKAGSPILAAAMLGEADGVPVHFARLYFPVERFPTVADVFSHIPLGQRSAISMSDLTGRLGVKSFRRKSARIRCRLPEADEARHLKMSAHDPVFQLDILNISDSDMPVFFSVNCYCGSRIDFILDY